MRNLRFGELRKVCEGTGGEKMFLLNGKTDETLKALDSLFLNEFESKAYFALLVKRECKPMDVVRLSGIPQSKIYWILQDLAEKKMVIQTQAKPMKVKPVELGIVLAQFKADRIAEYRRALSSVKYLREILTSLEKVAEEYEGQFRIFEPRARRR
jgi:sugar-specific transcriptional regulator TrmB